MSEPKRVPLQTLEFPDSLGHAAKKDKDKKLLPSHRFTLTLPEPNEERCPEFNYIQLQKTAEVCNIISMLEKNDPFAFEHENFSIPNLESPLSLVWVDDYYFFFV